mmetsp:Transcript_19965/g.79613  ORF Transcript_19965/g.79613 Transcript_19965/m.79613 type:complete len:83 (-) Transcript_19965:1381-1629(-)
MERRARVCTQNFARGATSLGRKHHRVQTMEAPDERSTGEVAVVEALDVVAVVEFPDGSASDCEDEKEAIGVGRMIAGGAVLG